MVTDSQYKELQKKVDELGKTIKVLSAQISTMMMKQDTSLHKTQPKTFWERETCRDTTKYEYKNELYCKRQLVYAVVRDYINEHDACTYIAIKAAFPDFLQGSLGVVKPIEVANMYSGADKRFFFSDDQILSLADKNYVVCSQWDVKNIKRFLKRADELGIEIKEFRFE